MKLHSRKKKKLVVVVVAEVVVVVIRLREQTTRDQHHQHYLVRTTQHTSLIHYCQNPLGPTVSRILPAGFDHSIDSSMTLYLDHI
jgi:hypothetical protein